MIDRTTTALIADIKRMGSIPNSQALYTDQNFVDAMNDCQSATVIPQIMRVREEFFVTHSDIALVSGQRDYDIPVRAIGHKVRQIILVDGSGNEVRLPRIEPENASLHETYVWWPGTKSGYQFVGNKIRLTPGLDASYTTLRVYYFRRPNNLALTENAGQVESVNTNTGIVQLVGSLPTGWAAGRLLDIQKGDSPFDSLADDEPILGVDSTGRTVTVSLATAALLSAGDWLCDAGECVIPQYPAELHRILTSYVLIDVLKHLGDTQGAANAAAMLDTLVNDFNTLISNRDEGSPRKIFSRRGLWNSGRF